MKHAGETTSDEAQALLQNRVASFALSFGAIMLVGVIGRTIAVLRYPEELAFVPAGTLGFQAAATGCLLVIYLLTRGRPRSAGFVRVVEASGLLAAGACLEVVAFGMTERLLWGGAIHDMLRDPHTRIFGYFALVMPLIGLAFVLTYAMVMRAAFVPTSARHTTLLTLAVGAPLVPIGFLAGSAADGMGYHLFSSSSLATGAAIQWGITTVVCTMISKVIYGLREEVREAKRLGQYTLEGLIGEGGMGMVYRASHAMLRRPTAIKLLAPDRAGTEALERFEREVQLTAQLTHPNTVTIFDYGRTDDGVLYYAMELLDGATLEEVVEIDGPQPPARVVRVLEQVAGALGEAHTIGLIHRDVKPANIVLARQGGENDVAKVVDFGLVKEIERRVGATVSREGTISGTPLYMAPEILTEPDAGSPRSDLYALGAVGYYMLTGQHVFEGKTVIEILGHHMHSAPMAPSVRLGDRVPEELERLILDCLAKDPAERPQSASELRRRLEQCDVPRWTQRKAQLWWEAHGPGLSERRTSGPPPRSETTMTVDLVTRKA